MREIKVTLFRTFDSEGDSWHFGSPEYASKFINEKIQTDDYVSYAMEIVDWKPVDINNPQGMLYGGMEYFDYQEVGDFSEI